MLHYLPPEPLDGGDTAYYVLFSYQTEAGRGKGKIPKKMSKSEVQFGNFVAQRVRGGTAKKSAKVVTTTAPQEARPLHVVFRGTIAGAAETDNARPWLWMGHSASGWFLGSAASKAGCANAVTSIRVSVG